MILKAYFTMIIGAVATALLAMLYLMFATPEGRLTTVVVIAGFIGLYIVGYIIEKIIDIIVNYKERKSS